MTPHIRSLIQELDTEDIREQRRASRELMAAGSDAVLALTEALASGTARIRKAAAYLLGVNAGPAGAVRALAHSLIEDPEPKVRRNAAESLGRTGTSEEVSPLVQALDAEAVSWVRRSIILALGAIGGEGAHAALQAVLPRNEVELEALRLALDRALPQRQVVSWREGGSPPLSVCLEVPRGLEVATQLEAAEHGVAPLVSVREGLLRCPLGTTPSALLPTLRCTYGLLIEAASGPPIRLDQPAEAAGRVAALVSQSAELRHWKKWLAVEEDVLRYRFSLPHAPVLREQFRSLLRSVCEAGLPLGLRNSPSNYDIELLLHRDAAGSNLFIRPNFVKDTRFLYRRKDVGVAIDPIIAACLARIGRVSVGGTVFDPTCGSATLLIERALLDSDVRLIGQDISRTAVAAARVNIAAAGLTHRIQIRRGDSKLVETWPSCDEVLANLPFGMRTGRGELDLPALYRAVLANLVGRLQPGGRAVLYTAHRKALESSLSLYRRSLHLQDQLRVSAGGLWVHVWVLSLRRPPEQPATGRSP